MKRAEGCRPVYSALGIGTPILRVCAALSAIEREWPGIVGHALASRSSLKSYGDGVLVVSVDGQAAVHDMNFKKNEIVREIRNKVRLKLNDLKIETDRPRRLTSAADQSRPRKRRAAAKIDQAALESITDEILSSYSDLTPELARSIARCRLMTDRGAMKK
jgi:hypothetical protein